MTPYKFTGKDGSMGLVTGRVYCLDLIGSTDGSLVATMRQSRFKYIDKQFLADPDHAIWSVPYSSYAHFANNWEPIDG